MELIFDYLQTQLKELRILNVAREDTISIKKMASKFDGCEKIVVIGTGGSSLGGKCLVNIAAGLKGKSPRVIFLENVDSLTFLNSIQRLDQNKTGIIVISKSGKTTESLMLFLTLLELWPNFDYKSRAMAITELSEDNDLRNLADSLDMEIVEHDKNIGGRFSVFSVVGLLPAFLEGWDIDSFRQGGREVLNQLEICHHYKESALFLEAIGMFEEFSTGTIDQHVLMIYSDLLEDYGKWFAQLIGESLGKSECFGITPVRAIGSIDQHSLLQLFLAGPKNKLYTVLGIERESNSDRIPRIERGHNSPSGQNRVIERLENKTIYEIMNMHRRSTIAALKECGVVREILLDGLDEPSLGEVMMREIIVVITLARRADINPFDQPAVEGLKQKLS
ncbi:MAG: hypothetical protein LBI20_00565 [Holosporales bacterium]|nr:hypothetical protein [Holosporales bacterium]